MTTFRARWAGFRESRFFPACVVMLLLAVAAGLFAGSYTFAMANPTPHHLPIGVTGPTDPRGAAFGAELDRALDTQVRFRTYATYQDARNAIEDQKIFAIIQAEGGNDVTLDIASAAGASVAQLLVKSATTAAQATGVTVAFRDLKPLQSGDPRGLAIFYITLAAVILGFVGAIQLSVNARALDPGERVAFVAGNACLGAFTIVAVVDWWIGALKLPLPESWAILALTMFTSGMVFSMFNALVGRWAIVPTWGLMVLLGNPSSGGAVSWALLPSVLGRIGQWLPPGASVNAQHTAVYFPDHQHAFPFLVLAAWAAVSTTVFWIWRERHPGGQQNNPPPEPAAA
ncbi:ABC transporter permease [Yinghuangia sp. ASG 101]|uniref:ABC transporter permease n=1 Tax=Yinghuangia sp. ASG 101 TaxID=2896848 RepID=UPI001E583D48|nr:ABC transporter permease [Yinghuangia sp. ASG 101]UGQ12149.1 ABC transporter permease [Yinghuangia sp. ASG 101]